MVVELCGRCAAAAKDGPIPPLQSAIARNGDTSAVPVSNAVGCTILGTAFAGMMSALVGGVIDAGMPYAIRLLSEHN